MNQNTRPTIRPRSGTQRMKILVDAPAPRQDAKTATLSARDRAALTELSNANRLKGNGASKDVNGKENPKAGRARSSSVTIQQQQQQQPTQQQPSSRIVVHRQNTSTRIPTSRHHQTQSSAAAAATFRPSNARVREEEEESTSRKRVRAPDVVPQNAPLRVVALEPVPTTYPDWMETSDSEFDDAVEQLDVPEDEEDVVEEQTVHALPQETASPERFVGSMDWTLASPETEARYEEHVQHIKETFKDEVDEYDASMVSEYSEEIFAYMGKLEVQSMADPDYMDNQTEIEWGMRATLVDWLIQVHARYHLLPETLWIAINVMDRFLSKRVVSLVKLQLVGITAMFIAAKYEEIMAPSVEEFVFMTEGGYTKDEILKGERIILQTLGFHVSAYCSPYSWVRRISKADDYDVQTRTLSKFLMEVCLLDHRFLRAKPSMIAAIAMFTARKMLGGDWNDGFIYYSGYTPEQLEPGHEYMMQTIASENFGANYICKKYVHKKFLKASNFAREWVAAYYAGPRSEDYDDECYREEMVVDRA